MSRKKSHFGKDELKEIGLRIRIERKKRALSQAEFGKSIGISGNYVSDLEAGKVEPRKPILLAIEYRYAIRPEYFLTGAHPKYVDKNDSGVYGVAEERAVYGGKERRSGKDRRRVVEDQATAKLAQIIKEVAEISDLKQRLAALEEKLAAKD